MILEDCRRVNVLIGYPNVGKSNILEAISLLSFIPEERYAIQLKELVRYERFTQLFNYFRIEQPIRLELNENYVVEIGYQDEKCLNFYPIQTKSGEDAGNKNLQPLKVENVQSFSNYTNNIDDYSGKFHDLQNFEVKPYKFPSPKSFDQSFSALSLRAPYGNNFFEVMINNEELQKEFDELLKPYDLKLLIDIDSNEVKVAHTGEDGRIIRAIPLNLLADTLVRLIFFKSAILTNSNSVLLFEEPESHMFPPYIGKLTSDIIFDKNNNQYFIATHSPFVLNDFIEDMDRDDLSIYLVGLEDGETKVKMLSEEEVSEVSLYGVDLFFNLESYFNNGSVGNA